MNIIKALLPCVFLLLFAASSSQSDINYKANSIPIELKANANAVVRYNNIVVEINDFDDMLVTTKRVVTVLNEYGNRHQNAFEGYDSNTKIKKMEARIYDAFGEEIKKVKLRDFTDQSAVSGGTLYDDSRVKFLNYTPLKYPYTIVYESEVQKRSTSFVPQWRPIGGYYVSVEKSEYKINNPNKIETPQERKSFTENHPKYNPYHVHLSSV